MLAMLVASALIAQAEPTHSFESLVPDATPVLISDEHKFTEGPLWYNGSLYFCDLHEAKIYKWVPEADTELEEWKGKAEVFISDSERAAGLGTNQNGDMLLMQFAGKISKADAEGNLTTVIDSHDGKRLSMVNDMVRHSDGSIFFTNPARGPRSESGIFRLTPDGATTVVATDRHFPNGIAFSPDEQTLYYSAYATNIIYAMDIDKEGAASNRRTFADLSNLNIRGKTDGMTVDQHGHIFASAPGGVRVFAPDGTTLGTIELPGVSNCCFGGPDGTTLFITAGPNVYCVKTATTAPILPASS